MSQEVSKWLVNGLQPTYELGICGLQPTYQPFTNFLGHPSSLPTLALQVFFVSWEGSSEN